MPILFGRREARARIDFYPVGTRLHPHEKDNLRLSRAPVSQRPSYNQPGILDVAWCVLCRLGQLHLESPAVPELPMVSLPVRYSVAGRWSSCVVLLGLGRSLRRLRCINLWISREFRHVRCWEVSLFRLIASTPGNGATLKCPGGV